MIKLDADASPSPRTKTPDFNRDYAMLEAAVRDCAIAYFWNPIVSPNEFEYKGWSTTLYGGIDHGDRTAYIVFRGTDQLIDWTVNCFFIPLPLAHPLAHAGFVLTWKIAKRRLVPWLRTQAGSFDKIVVSGHSLGGALALACAYDLEREGFKIERCITVGSPRVYTFFAGKSVEEKLGSRVLRLFRRQDVVSKVPPKLLGFRHVGKEWVYVGELFGEREPEPLSSTSRWLDKLWYFAVGGRLGDWLAHGNESAKANFPLLLVAAVGSLGGGFVLLAQMLQYSLLALMTATFVFVVASSVLIAIAAHRSGKYAATRNATNLIEEWQKHYLRKISAAQKVVSTSKGKRIVEFTVEISASHDSDDYKRRLVGSFLKYFGEDSFCTELGQLVRQTLKMDPNGRASAFLKSLPVDQQFEAICVALLLFGYESDDIDLMLEDGIIRRPKNWSRYYSLPNQDKARTTSEAESPRTPAPACRRSPP